ncbi:hypothetical protein Pmob_1287 [Petrotoga mobilis SJ95]|uniref:Glycosyltransferase subfamily 4-like N-terminal domain-containing protein n=1 Tax=Petrotoga mobilis (strain DSM 10674 / SJ95) TaxID=403833 RepID=A9BGE9_PETMO|nr:hypothetical protein [Petrotoga mobilis]ABX31999.1 hypothetical protein Pmob_1287 [Petrotoga mobilis SJ95]
MNKINNILIITYNMIPYSPNWGGCQRVYYFAKELSKTNNVFMISAKKNYYGDFGQEIPFEIYYIENYIETFYREKKTNSYFHYNKNKGRKLIEKLLNSLGNIYKKIDKFLFNEPNPGIGFIAFIWTRKIKNKVFQIIEQNNINKVLISGPPFSIFHIVKIIKKRFPNIEIILDYRDPWNFWNNLNNKITTNREKKYLRFTDKIISPNENLTKDLNDSFSLSSLRKKIITIRNGYSEESWKNIKINKETSNDKIIISHIGSIGFKDSGYRNPTEFLKAFYNYEKNYEFLIRFIGVDRDKYTNSYKKLLGEKIEFIERVDQQKSFEYMLQSDILLLLHTEKSNANKYVYTGKFFDYIRSGRIILGIGDDNVLFNKMIKKYDLGFTTRNEKEEIKKALDLILKHKNRLIRNSDIDIYKFSREYQNNKLIPFINK